MHFIGNALKCYKGNFLSNDKSAKPMEPKLVDCKGNEDVCASSYAKTDLYFEYGFEDPAGSWEKSCFKKSKLPEFGDGASDRCIESKKNVKVRYINPCFIY